MKGPRDFFGNHNTEHFNTSKQTFWAKTRLLAIPKIIKMHIPKVILQFTFWRLKMYFPIIML